MGYQKIDLEKDGGHIQATSTNITLKYAADVYFHSSRNDFHSKFNSHFGEYR